MREYGNRFGPTALPIYIVRSRGWRGCALLLIHAAALSLAACAIGIAAALLQNVGR